MDGKGRFDEVIDWYRKALALRPPGHPNRSDSFNNLANALSTRFKQEGKIEDLEEAITHYRQALALLSTGHHNLSASLNNLAISLSTRFKQLGKTEDLEEAITYYRRALVLDPADHPERYASLNNLANALASRFKQQGKEEDLEGAISCHRQALVLVPPGHPHRSAALDHLGNSLSTRFKQLGRMADLEEAIMYYRRALALDSPGDPHYSSSLNNLAITLYTRFKKLGKMEDLDGAIMYHRQALILRSPGHRNRLSSLNNLAVALSARFEQLGEMRDLEEAILHHREALVLRPQGHPDRFSSLSNLAGNLSTRFDQLGKMEDLEEAIIYHRQALLLRPPGHLDRPISLNNLATALSHRFNHLGKMEDLEEGIMYHRQALNLRPPGHYHRYSSLNNLANALFRRFKQLDHIEDLEEGTTYYRQVLDICPPGHPHRFKSLNNLANALVAHFDILGKTGDLEQAILYCRQALVLCPPGHPDRSASLSNFAHALSTHFDKLGKMEDLEEATKYLSDADVILPAEHPRHATIRNKLASNYLKQHDLNPISDHYLAIAFTLFESAANHSTASATTRFRAAQNWAIAAQQRKHKSSVHAYSKMFSLLNHCLIAYPTIESQQKYLATKVPKSLASDAASSAIAAGQIETAVELLEQARATLWSKMQGYRHPLDQLRQVDEELADQFKMLSTQLEHHAISSESESMLSPTTSDGVSFEAKMQVHRVVSDKWNEVVEKIRKIDGFTDFLCTVPFTTLQAAALEGPVIMVNVNKHRSDAIIICDVGPPVLVPLPRGLPRTLTRLSSQLMDAQALDPVDSPKKILPILRDLWDLIIFPVKDQLALLGVAEKARIWWCPTSELCALPLHAAGPYLRNQKNLPDIYVSSYTPTLSSLIKARSSAVGRCTVPSLLVVAQPGNDIPRVEEELHQVQKFGGFIKILVGGEANPTSVLSGLQQHSWVHFACHGHQEVAPFQSSFQLHSNIRLTLLDLIKAQLPNAEFAFLSACHSAAGDRGDTPDEVIHLASALQFSGFRSVVGTLWAMADIDGSDIAKDFYTYMFRRQGSVADFKDSAIALNIATRNMRRKRGITVDRWINFVHIGA